jgi:hypothetical protein
MVSTQEEPVATRAVRTLGIVVVVLGLLLLSGSPVHAQASFRVIHKVDKVGSTEVEISGRVFNDARVEALQVSVTAEALNASGRVVASGIAFVSPLISEGASAPFTAKVPAVPGIARYRVAVTRYRLGLGSTQAP